MIDYEKKYKEALERANSFQEKYGGDYAGYIFPELRESEDERIRKWLLECVENLSDRYFIEVSKQNVLFYLERQKVFTENGNGVSF